LRFHSAHNDTETQTDNKKLKHLPNLPPDRDHSNDGALSLRIPLRLQHTAKAKRGARESQGLRMLAPLACPCAADAVDAGTAAFVASPSCGTFATPAAAEGSEMDR